MPEFSVVLAAVVLIQFAKSMEFFSPDAIEHDREMLGNSQQILTDTSNFTVFNSVFGDAYFAGTWNVSSPQRELFYKMDKTSGDCYMMYNLNEKTNQTNMSLVLTVDSYRDSAKVYFTINLTNATNDNVTSTMAIISTGAKPGPFQMRVLEARYGSVTDLSQYVPANITLVFRNKTNGQPVDIRTSDKPEDLETSLQIQFTKEPGILSAVFTFYKGGGGLSLWRYFFVFGALCISVLFWTGMVKFIRIRDHFLFARTEFCGLIMLCLQMNQLFGLVLIDALESTGLMMTLSSIVLGVAGCLCGSVCVLIAVFCNMHFVVQRFGNGHIECNRCKLITILSSAFVVIFFLTLGMVYHLNPYVHITVILITSTFPLIHVAETAFRKSHETFQPWIQLGFWPCSLYFSLILRGVGNSFINLTPFPWVGLTQIGIISLGILVSYLQSKHGPRFFLPYSWQSGLLKIRTSANTLTTAEQETECCICYGVLGHPIPTIDNTPQKDDALSTGNDQSDLETRLNSPEEKSGDPGKDTTEWISRPKCGHLYHESCLKSWLVNKQQCPMCKSQIEL